MPASVSAFGCIAVFWLASLMTRVESGVIKRTQSWKSAACPRLILCGFGKSLSLETGEVKIDRSTTPCTPDILQLFTPQNAKLGHHCRSHLGCTV